MIIQYLYSCFIIYHHSHPLSTHRKNNNIYQKRKNYKILVPTEYTIREKLLLLSFISSILFSSSCPSTFPSSSALSILCSLCFSFSVLSCTFVSSLLDSGYENCSLSESWPYILVNFSNATAILWTFFLKPHNLLKFSNFLKTSAFYFASVCCFDFLVFNL